MLEFPEPQSLKVLEIGNSKDMRKVVYSVDNPHPLYGKDPNVINELGHTIYPKMVYPNGNDQPGVIVKSSKEEAELLGKVHEDVKAENHVSDLDEIEELEKKLAERKARLQMKMENEHPESKEGHSWD